MPRKLILLLALALVAPAMPPARAGLQAQVRAVTPPPQTVTVALVDTLPSLRERYAAVILRTAGPAGRDLVLLPRAAASGALLDAATRTLLHARATQGLRPAALHGRPFQTITLGVRYSEAPLEWALQNVPRAQGLVDRLLVAPPRAVPGVGVVPALVFYPPTPTSARGASQGGRASPGGPRR